MALALDAPVELVTLDGVDRLAGKTAWFYEVDGFFGPTATFGAIRNAVDSISHWTFEEDAAHEDDFDYETGQRYLWMHVDEPGKTVPHLVTNPAYWDKFVAVNGKALYVPTNYEDRNALTAAVQTIKVEHGHMPGEAFDRPSISLGGARRRH